MKNIKLYLLFCSIIPLGVNAQIYQYDDPVIFPTQDLYDTGSMMMLLQSAKERASRSEAKWYHDDSAYNERNDRHHRRVINRKNKLELFEELLSLAKAAFYREHWDDVISYCSRALNTGFYNGDVFYLRGYALESKGFYVEAKKNYKKARKNGSHNVEIDIKRLNDKSKAKKTNRRKSKRFRYFKTLVEAEYYRDNWLKVIDLVNQYSKKDLIDGDVYFYRGMAYESLGYFMWAREDYERAEKKGCKNATQALQRVNRK